MLRQWLHVLRRHFQQHNNIGYERHALRRITRQSMRMETFSVDPRGTWSPVQAKRVLAIIASEAARHGLVFKQIDVTTFNMPNQRVLLVAYCQEHDVAVLSDTICALCLRAAHKR